MKNQPSLQSSIEKSQDTNPILIEVLKEENTVEDLLEFTNSFLAELSALPKMEGLDLGTPEKAAESLRIIEKQSSYLGQKIKSAAKLKDLLMRKLAIEEKISI